MKANIAIVDFGMGNLLSIKKKISRIGGVCTISSSSAEIEKADKIILPGVGHFQRAMENLSRLKLIEPLNELVLIKKKPVLGICLGMQLMAKESEEGNAAGLGWMDAKVCRFKIKDKIRYKIPHIGWNSICIVKNSILMREIEPNAEFYFVHSYYWQEKSESQVLNRTEHESAFTSAVEMENLFGVQYHPEKSHNTGEQLLKNFILL